MFASNDLEDLCQTAVDTVKPSHNTEDAFRSELEVVIKLTRDTAERAWTTPGRIVADAKKFQKAIERVSNQIEAMREITRALIFRGLPDAVESVELSAFRGELGRISETAKFLTGITVPPGAPPTPLAKHVAAIGAYNLLAAFAPRPPSLTKEGPLFALASIIFEAATGESESDLTDYCTKVFDDKRTYGA